MNTAVVSRLGPTQKSKPAPNPPLSSTPVKVKPVTPCPAPETSPRPIFDANIDASVDTTSSDSGEVERDNQQEVPVGAAYLTFNYIKHFKRILGFFNFKVQ